MTIESPRAGNKFNEKKSCFMQTFQIARFATGLVLVALTYSVTGCEKKPTPITIPAYDPEGMAQRALTEHDTNKDGKLAGSELDGAPSLKNSLSQLDKNKDGALSADEIAERLRLFQESKGGLLTLPCTITRDGQGVSGVTVTFVPEKFMGDAIKPAKAISEAGGALRLGVEGESAPGLSPGFYRVEASIKDAAGNETLPARYNTKTILGHEVSPYQRGEITIRLGP